MPRKKDSITEQGPEFASSSIQSSEPVQDNESVQNEAPVLEEGFVMVMPLKGNMFEPFQRIAIREGLATPVKMTSWVECQISAGLLRVVEQ